MRPARGFWDWAGHIERKGMDGCLHPATAPHHDCREVNITGRDAKAYSQPQYKCAHCVLLFLVLIHAGMSQASRSLTTTMLLISTRRGTNPQTISGYLSTTS